MSLLLAAAVAASPFVFPQGDVVVTYGIAGEAGVQQTLSVAAASGLERLDAPGGLLSIVTDTVHGTAIVIDRQTDTYVRETAPGGAQDMRHRAAAAGTYTAVGRATVAGLACTRYASRDPATGGTVRSCFTADGILLRTEAQGGPALVAITVVRGAVDPSRFRPPADARDVTPPA